MRKIKQKIKNINDLALICEKEREHKKSVIFTNGCFDIIHLGHVKYLEESKAYGDLLVVGINSDISVKSIKGVNRPILNENVRSSIIAALESVDFVFLFDEDTPERAIRTIRPDILVKGGDWDISKIAGGDFVKDNGGSVKSIPLVDGFSTTNIIETIKNCG